MQQPEAIDYINQKLPGRLMNDLRNLAKKYRKKGGHLFIFGSFATFNDESTSDLDLGISWDNEPKDRIFTQLYRDIQDLPTIRKVDLVDMAKVDDAFKKEAMKNAVYL